MKVDSCFKFLYWPNEFGDSFASHWVYYKIGYFELDSILLKCLPEKIQAWVPFALSLHDIRLSKLKIKSYSLDDKHFISFIVFRL